MKFTRAGALTIAFLCGWAGTALMAVGAQPGNVSTWGNYYDGSIFSPVALPGSLTNVVAIAGGAGHSLALRQEGTVTAWGYN